MRGINYASVSMKQPQIKVTCENCKAEKNYIADQGTRYAHINRLIIPFRPNHQSLLIYFCGKACKKEYLQSKKQ